MRQMWYELIFANMAMVDMNKESMMHDINKEIIMVKMTYWFMFCVAAMVIIMVIWAFPGNAHAANTEKQGSAPVITLKMWDSSSELEQYAFLAGIVSVFELEKEWQGQKGILPLRQSMVGSWCTGLDGMSLTQIRSAVNSYSMNNPSKQDRLVLDVLWSELVQPKLKVSMPGSGSDTSTRLEQTMGSHKKQKTQPAY